MMGRAARATIMGVATATTGSTLAHGIEGAFPGAEPQDVTGLSGAHIDSGSTFHHGPLSGGEQLDRPSTGYMADSSMTQGMELERGDGISTIARDIDKAGTMTIDGQQYSVLDYVPGGDIVQLAGGSVNPAQVAMLLAQHGIQQGMDGRMVDAQGRPVDPGTLDLASGTSRSDGSLDEANGQDQRVPATAQEAIAGGAGAIAAAKAAGMQVPDEDEDARDREQLALMHRLDVDTAVETSDSARVTTEIHAHGRTLEINTDFEATADSNREEREEASEHVMETAHAPLSETEHNRRDMHFRSKVQAHLDAASQDQGMGI